MSINKETLVTIFLSVVLVGLSIILFVVATPIFFPGDDVSQEKVSPETEVSQEVQNSVLYEGVRDDLAMKIEGSRETYFRDREYQAAIQSLQEAQAENADLSPAEEGRLLLTLAQQKLRNETHEGLRIMVSLYRNEDYTDRVRAEALETVTWHMTGKLVHFSEWNQVQLHETPEQTPRELFVDIYGPNGLNIVAPEQVVTLNDAGRVMIQSLEMVLDIAPDRFISRAFLALNYAKLATFAESAQEAEALAQIAKAEMNFASESAGRNEDQSLRDNEYDNYVATFKYQSLRTGQLLYFAGQEDIEILEVRLQEIIAYNDRFTNDSFLPLLFNANAVEKYVLSLADANDNNLDEEQRQQVRNLVLNRYITLPDEDLERRIYPRFLGSNEGELDEVRSRQRAAYQYLAREVVPEWQPTLINKIGGWTEEDFQ